MCRLQAASRRTTVAICITKWTSDHVDHVREKRMQHPTTGGQSKNGKTSHNTFAASSRFSVTNAASRGHGAPLRSSTFYEASWTNIKQSRHSLALHLLFSTDSPIDTVATTPLPSLPCAPKRRSALHFCAKLRRLVLTMRSRRPRPHGGGFSCCHQRRQFVAEPWPSQSSSSPCTTRCVF